MLCPLSIVAESLRLTLPLKKEPKVYANSKILSDITTPSETRLAAAKAKLATESEIADELRYSQSAV
jgi:hypothetical protein